jgi:hypothetical protein
MIKYRHMQQWSLQMLASGVYEVMQTSLSAHMWHPMYSPLIQLYNIVSIKDLLTLKDEHMDFVLFLIQVTELPFFASKVRLGRCGIDEVYGLGPLNEYER